MGRLDQGQDCQIHEDVLDLFGHGVPPWSRRLRAAGVHNGRLSACSEELVRKYAGTVVPPRPVSPSYAFAAGADFESALSKPFLSPPGRPITATLCIPARVASIHHKDSFKLHIALLSAIVSLGARGGACFQFSLIAIASCARFVLEKTYALSRARAPCRS